jgi:hypothetical protein
MKPRTPSPVAIDCPWRMKVAPVDLMGESLTGRLVEMFSLGSYKVSQFSYNA